jgi:hypothetical protein
MVSFYGSSLNDDVRERSQKFAIRVVVMLCVYSMREDFKNPLNSNKSKNLADFYLYANFSHLLRAINFYN